MADWQENLPTIQRATAINSATVKNRMETKRLAETLESLNRDHSRSLRKISAAQENLVNCRHADAVHISAGEKQKISKSNCSLAGLQLETGCELSQRIDGKTRLSDWHVQGRDGNMCGALGVETTLTKSVVFSEEQIQDPVAYLEFSPFATKEKADDETKLRKQKVKHRSSSGTFHLRPQGHKLCSLGKAPKALTPPIQKAAATKRMHARIASDPTLELFQRKTVSPICDRRQELFSRSQRFSRSTPSLHNKWTFSSHSPAPERDRDVWNHQLLQVSKSLQKKSSLPPGFFLLPCSYVLCQSKADFSMEKPGKLNAPDQVKILKGSRYLGRDISTNRSSLASAKPDFAMSPCSCVYCQSAASSSIISCKEEFAKLNLADQMEILKGSRYLRLPTRSKSSSK
ncbi:uncharacterized protein LOC134186946 [Corticium candelabrum]|uniref:uncharacterized protein LOC134186946 n=1 Tax=Corticium candelabrum TaxID=121492 RepID=UPI002E2751D9|nr:uncharacterized protein LOC134186946 [Corticium candelabrum]